jgi:hypothetical protein
MSTIADLIARIEADQRAMLKSPHTKRMRADLEAAAEHHRKLMDQFELSPVMQRMMAEADAMAKKAEEFARQFEIPAGLLALREDILRAAEEHNNAMKFREDILAMTKAQPIVEYPMVPARELLPPARFESQLEPLPKRTIVRREVKRKIGFKNE